MIETDKKSIYQAKMKIWNKIKNKIKNINNSEKRKLTISGMDDINFENTRTRS